MRVLFALVAIAFLGGCTARAPNREWTRHDFNLSGKHVFISTPRGDMNDQTASSLSSARDIALLQRAWIFSSSGAVEVKLFLRQLMASPNGDFFAHASRLLLDDVRRAFPAAEIVNVKPRNIGGKPWTCYVVTRIEISDCVLQVDPNTYLSWRAYWIGNMQPDAPEEAKRMVEEIERSIEIAF